jgi:hypothetical protein
MDIPPNFGVNQFKKKKEATGFLRRFGSELILRRSDCDVWETKEKPLISQGLKTGAGEEGRTPDLMLGKHTL